MPEAPILAIQLLFLTVHRSIGRRLPFYAVLALDYPCYMILRLRHLILSLLIIVGLFRQAEGQVAEAGGSVLDAQTGEPIAAVTVAALKADAATRTDNAGRFFIQAAQPFSELRFTAVGYQTLTVDLSKKDPSDLQIALQPANEQLGEVTIRPKKYRNKNNPAVELIELVVKNRDRNRLESMQTFQEERYEKYLLGFNNVPKRWTERRLMKDFRFVLTNIDTTKLAGASVAPIFLQENIADFYYRKKPAGAKQYVRANQSVRFPGMLEDEGMAKTLQYLNQEINLYDNYVVLLTNHFLSPIANNAPLFYRYYPVDTTEISGSKIVQLAFFPRNKTDMLLQGDLYVALDSTYPVTRVVFTVNPGINLNWVKTLMMEQRFQKLPSGRWLLEHEDYRMDFGLMSKRGASMYGERVVSHRAPSIDPVLADSLFKASADIAYQPDAKRPRDTIFWKNARDPDLKPPEAATYGNMDSLQRTRTFKIISSLSKLGILGHIKAGPNFEIGRTNTFYSFNAVEGTRLRFGGRTTTRFSQKYYADGYGAYGLGDYRWKYGANVVMAFGTSQHNRFPFNLLRVGYQRDLRTPGQDLNQVQASNLGTSVVRGINDRFFLIDRFNAQYEREYENNFSYTTGYEHRVIQSAGSLRFIPTDDRLRPDAPITINRAFVQLRYAPGEKFFQTTGGRQRINFNSITTVRYGRGFSGPFGGQYDYHEAQVSFYKFSNTPPIGYNYLQIEAGGTFGRVPYPLLNIHTANQGYFFQGLNYNLMNFMEFASDRYVALTVNHSFYGFFLNKIPLVRKLQLREMAGVKILYGGVSARNQPNPGAGLYQFPVNPDGSPITYTLSARPYVEANIGIGNILKFIRIDLVRRFTYLDHPGVAKYGIRASIQAQF